MPSKNKTSSVNSTIIDNKNRGSVGEFLKNNIEDNSDLSVVSAYFTIYAYKALKDKLDSIHKLKFLFGEPTFLKSIDPNKGDKMQFVIKDDKLEIPADKQLEQKGAARECAEWIRKKVDIKSIVKPNFLHGKMYHIRKINGIEKAVMGSSNFTVSGLGLSDNSNIELNMVIDSDRDRTDILNWFMEIWEDKSGIVEDVKDEVLNYLSKLYKENSPQFIYYKTLYHIFENYLDEEGSSNILDEKIGFLETEVWNMLYDFQKDGVKGAINKTLKHNGCIIADSVGLGKTFEALAVIKYFELLNHRVLVLCPKKLRENWAVFRRNDNLNFLLKDKFSYDILCHTDLSRSSGYSGEVNLSTVNWGNYGLVVIDESHNFRNDFMGKKNQDGNIKLSRYGRLMNDIIKSGIQTKVLLLSATPVNNNLQDLRNQIYIITQGENAALRETAHIRDIGQTIKNAQAQFSIWANPQKNPDRSTKDLLEKIDSSFFRLLDELTISRSRKHIQNHYDVNKLGKFPVRLKPISITTNIDMKKEFPTYDELNNEILEYKLSIFRPSAYIKEEFKALYEQRQKISGANFDQETRENYLIGMMKVNFLKRLESSIESFEISMKRTIDKMQMLEDKINEFKSNNINDAELEDLLVLPEDEDEEDSSKLVGEKLKFNLAHLKLDKWLKDIEKDKIQLTYLYNESKKVIEDRDEKLCRLKKLIEDKVQNPINAIQTNTGERVPNKKIIIFTAFADTASYLYNSLVKWVTDDLNLNIALITGGNENKTTFKLKGFKNQHGYNEILTNFSPRAKNRNKMNGMPQDGEIDILIATDCISEGQNLQDCDYLVNFDIHWNPVRIIQRFGRIDRLGSSNEKIQMVNFWTTDDLNKYIDLKDRVESRMALVDITATGTDNLLSIEQIDDNVKDNLSFRDKQLLRLKDEVLDLEDLDGNISLSDFNLSDFRADLINFLKGNEKLLADNPYGLYGIVPAAKTLVNNVIYYEHLDVAVKHIIKPGVLFCFRQKGNTSDNEVVNPIQSYFLTYIYEDGTVKFNYTNAKQILELYRVLCSNIVSPIEELCEIFEQETNHGKNMDKYSKLLKNAVNEIVRVLKKRNLKALQSGRDGVIVSRKDIASSTDDFELITWLIVK
jgi:ERCC4-related helicase